MGEISIIIPTYNRVKYLKKTILSYLSQENIKEIILINDNSSQDYCEIISYINSLCKKRNIDFKYIHNKKNYGAAKSREIGIKAAEGKFILWGEDDVILHKNYAQILLNKIINKNYDVVAGRIIYLHKNESINEAIERYKNINKKIFDYSILEGNYGILTKNDIELPWVHALYMCRKDWFENINIDQNYKGNGYREESDIQIRLLEKGARIFYTSDTICFHLFRNEGGQWKKGNLWRLYWKIANNNYFVNKNYEILKNRFKSELVYGKWELKINFILKEFKKINISKIKKFIKE